MPNTHWEYTTVLIDNITADDYDMGHHKQQISDEIETHGAAGWEFVSINDQAVEGYVHIIFRRPKE
jgi:hypothetical protein